MESDLRVGGIWKMSGTGQGKPFTIQGTYREVDPPHALEFTWLADFEPSGQTTRVRFDLSESNDITTVRLTHSGFATDQARAAYQGWPWLLSLLQAYAEGKSD